MNYIKNKFRVLIRKFWYGLFFFSKYRVLYRKYRKFTMIPQDVFVDNLKLCEQFKRLPGDVVECGVWRGGMIAAMAEIMGQARTYYLFDSFEGLPPAQAIDGSAAIAWQNDKTSPVYFDNCKAEQKFADRAMRLSGARSFKMLPGWFADTLPNFRPKRGIAILRLDGDWYESTMACLETLFDKVVTGGLIIIDDYYFWDGCAKAVHDFLSRRGLTTRIRQSPQGVCYIVK